MGLVKRVHLLIIGAGPFGLAMAAYARHLEIDHLVVGKPMDFWKRNMPKGMFLRSPCSWHLDPLGVHTIDAYLETLNFTPADVEPLSMDCYLKYAEWFRKEKEIEPFSAVVQRLDGGVGPRRPFRATLEGGEIIEADSVVLALGFKHFKHIPPELSAILPDGRFSHTCDFVEFGSLKGKRCLVVGGRQSAFEWAALLREHGADAVHVSLRHKTPNFEESDWSWVAPLLDAMVDEPGWYRQLLPLEKKEVDLRFWAEGRLKLEPWLWPRIDQDGVDVWPETEIKLCEEKESGELTISLSNGKELCIDHVILATGYKPNVARVPFLAEGNLLSSIEVKDGFPVLDKRFQCSVPGLYFTSMLATRDFGSFFAFTVSVGASAKIISASVVICIGVE